MGIIRTRLQSDKNLFTKNKQTWIGILPVILIRLPKNQAIEFVGNTYNKNGKDLENLTSFDRGSHLLVIEDSKVHQSLPF